MSNILNSHFYWLLNAGIALSYLFTCFTLKLPWMNNHLAQSQQLKFSRYVFIMVVSVFLLMPIILTKLPIHQNSIIELPPLLKHISMLYLKNHDSLAIQANLLPTLSMLQLITNTFNYLFSAGLIIFIVKYIKNFCVLRTLTKCSYRQRKIKNIEILLSETTSIPLCWSSIKSHFVIIPITFLEKNSDLKLAIRHELQHIRQGDTYWLYLFSLMKFLCYWNPFMRLWRNMLIERQEFACDETMILRRKTSCVSYAQCLIDTAAQLLKEDTMPQEALGLIKFGKNYHSILNRRITMLFQYKKPQKKWLFVVCAYVVCFLTASSIAYALSETSIAQPIVAKDANTINFDFDYQEREKNGAITQHFINKTIKTSLNNEWTAIQDTKNKSNNFILLSKIEKADAKEIQMKFLVLDAGPNPSILSAPELIVDYGKKGQIVIGDDKGNKLSLTVLANSK